MIYHISEHVLAHVYACSTLIQCILEPYDSYDCDWVFNLMMARWRSHWGPLSQSYCFMAFYWDKFQTHLENRPKDARSEKKQASPFMIHWYIFVGSWYKICFLHDTNIKVLETRREYVVTNLCLRDLSGLLVDFMDFWKILTMSYSNVF